MSKREVSLVDRMMRTLEGRRRFLQERTIVKVSEMIESTMEQQNVTRAALARKLGRTKGWVTQLLDGEQNMTVRTVADVLAVLDSEVKFHASPIEIGKRNILRMTSPVDWLSEGQWNRISTDSPRIAQHG